MSLHKLILGTVQLGKLYGINNLHGKPSHESALEILNYAADHGIKSFDTADNYGNSSEIIKEFNQNRNDNIQIYTKSKLSDRSLSQAVEYSSQLIGAKQLASFSLHDFSEIQHINPDEVFALKETSLINSFGVSVYTNEEIIKASKLNFIDSIQIPFNLLDNWSRRGAAISFAKENGKEIHCRSIFLQGLFVKDLGTLPTKLIPLRKPLEALHQMANELSVSVLDLAFSYVLSIPDIDRVLFGVETLEQLKKNVAYLGQKPLKLNAKDIHEIKIENESLLSPTKWA